MDIKKIWKRYKKSNDRIDRDFLIEYYLDFTKSIVGKFVSNLPNHIKMKDLLSSGVTGLIRAIESFKPEKKCRFESYAALLIKGSVIDELRQLDWVPRSIHQKSNDIGRVEQKLQMQLGRDPTEKEIAQAMEIPLKKLREILYQIKPAIFVYLNDSIAYEEETTLIAEKIPDQSVKPSSQIVDQKETHELLQKLMMHLNEKERQVVRYYYFEEMLLKDIGRKLKLSESRICQLHTAALSKLKQKLEAFK